jgi:hypothetical protein
MDAPDSGDTLPSKQVGAGGRSTEKWRIVHQKWKCLVDRAGGCRGSEHSRGLKQCTADS